MDKGFVYIIKDLGGRFYIGSTDNIQRRMCQYKIGYTQTTRNMVSPELVLTQEYESLGMTRKIERGLR